MKIRSVPPSGQSIVETAIMLPLLLLILGAGYWFYRNLSLSSSAESAAHAHMLRSGRNLAGIEARLSNTIHPEGDKVVKIETKCAPLANEVPLFRSLTGRSIASVAVSLEKEPVGAFLDLPSHAIRQKAEGTIDCWGKGTTSGATIRRTVQGILLTGALR